MQENTVCFGIAKHRHQGQVSVAVTTVPGVWCRQMVMWGPELLSLGWVAPETAPPPSPSPLLSIMPDRVRHRAAGELFCCHLQGSWSPVVRLATCFGPAMGHHNCTAASGPGRLAQGCCFGHGQWALSISLLQAGIQAVWKHGLKGTPLHHGESHF